MVGSLDRGLHGEVAAHPAPGLQRPCAPVLLPYPSLVAQGLGAPVSGPRKLATAAEVAVVGTGLGLGWRHVVRLVQPAPPKLVSFCSWEWSPPTAQICPQLPSLEAAVSLEAGCPPPYSTWLQLLLGYVWIRYMLQGAAGTAGLNLGACRSLARSGGSLELSVISSAPQSLARLERHGVQQ